MAHLTGDISPRMPQDIRVGHRCPAGSALARRVTYSADMSHSSHYDTRSTRGVFGDVSLDCDDDRYLPQQGLRQTLTLFRDFSDLLVPYMAIRAIESSVGGLVALMLVCVHRAPRQHTLWVSHESPRVTTRPDGFWRPRFSRPGSWRAPDLRRVTAGRRAGAVTPQWPPPRRPGPGRW